MPNQDAGFTQGSMGDFMEMQSRNRYQGLIDILNTPLYDPKADAESTAKTVLPVLSGARMGAKYKGMTGNRNVNDPRYAAIAAKIGGNASNMTKRRNEVQKSIAEDIGTAQQEENIAWDSDAMNHALRMYEMYTKTNQAKEQRDAQQQAAGVGAFSSLISAFL